MMVRQAVLKGKDPLKIIEDMEVIDKMGSLGLIFIFAHIRFLQNEYVQSIVGLLVCPFISVFLMCTLCLWSERIIHNCTFHP